MSDYTVTVSPANGSVQAAGDTATYQVQLTPHPVYATSVALQCTGLPPGAACNFTNQSVTLQGPGSSTLNITTTARPIVTPVASLLTRHFYAIWLAVPGLTLLGVGAGGRRRRRRILGMLMVCALFGAADAAAGVRYHDQAPVSGTPAGICRSRSLRRRAATPRVKTSRWRFRKTSFRNFGSVTRAEDDGQRKPTGATPVGRWSDLAKSYAFADSL